MTIADVNYNNQYKSLAGYSETMAAKEFNKDIKHKKTKYISYNISAFIIRIFDVLFSIIGIIFLAPLLLIVGFLVFLQDGGSIFFAQERIGKNGKKFRCYKFRSMLKNAPDLLHDYLEKNPEARAEWAKDHKLKNDPRITAFGSFIRKTSLDEFPQLLNVIKGEMSLVGPRPIVEGEIYKYGKSFKHYCAVKPGITGLWQVSGRNDTTYNRRVAIDRFFARKTSVLTYLYILFATIPAVLKQKGSY